MDLGTSASGTAVSFATWKTGPPARHNSSAAPRPDFTFSSWFANASNGDLHLTHGSAGTPTSFENVGTPLGGVTTDFDNDARDASTPDIGADEVTTMQFSAATYSVAGDVGGGLITITVNRTAGSGNTATINYNTSDNTAMGGASCGGDTAYVNTSGTLNFAAGDTAKSFNIPICNNGDLNDETVDIGLSGPTGGSIQGAPATSLLTIMGVTPTPTPTPSPGVTPTPTCGPFSQNFDGMTAPALPAGWVATNATGAPPLWVTSTTTPDTAPNDAFINGPSTVSDKRLETPNLAINSASGQVSFRNFYNLESTFDGGVLEVSSPNINGGAFTDITNAAVGGSFVSGGYNATISTGSSSPIAGRMAWSGDSGGYINTVANLGPNVNGQTIKLRFRMASDNGTSSAGWRVDTISIAAGPWRLSVAYGSTTTPTPTPTPTPSPTTPTPQRANTNANTILPTPTPTPTPTHQHRHQRPTPTPTPTPTPDPDLRRVA